MTVMRWGFGDGWAVVTRTFAVWLPGAPDAVLASELFELDDDEAFAAAGNLLARRASAYGLFQIDGPVVLQNRGAVPVAAWDRSGAALAGDLSTAAGVRLGTVPGDGTGFPIAHGVVACGSITWGVEVPAPRGSAAPRVAPEPARGPSVGAGPLPAGFIAEVPDWVAASPANPFAELWGHTMRRPVEAAAVRVVRDSDAEPEPPAEPLAPPPARPAAPDEPPAQPPPEPVPPVVARRASVRSETATLVGNLIEPDDGPVDHGELVTPDGRRVPILTTVVVGRAPEALPGQESQLLRVASPERGISRSHLLVGVIDGLVRAKDLGSNNGTVLVRGATRSRVGIDSWTALSSNDILDLGEGVTVRLVGLP